MDWKPHMRRIVDRLGEDVTYTNVIGVAVAIKGVFSEPALAVLGIESGSPTLSCIEDDVPAVKHDERFTIRGVVYKVKGVAPDPVSGVKKIALELK